MCSLTGSWHHTWQFLLGCWDSTSGPDVYLASPRLTEPCAKPHIYKMPGFLTGKLILSRVLLCDCYEAVRGKICTRNPAICLLVRPLKSCPSSQVPKRNILNLGITYMQNNETESLFLTIYVNGLFKMYQQAQRQYRKLL